LIAPAARAGCTRGNNSSLQKARTLEMVRDGKRRKDYNWLPDRIPVV